MENTKDEEATPEAHSENEDDLEALRNKYLHGKQRGNARARFADKRFIFNLILLCSVLISSLTTIIWFACPTITIGSKTYQSGTENLISFLFFGKNSMLEKIKAAISDLKNIDDSAVAAVPSTLVRLFLLSAGGLHILLETIIHFISAVNGFHKRDSKKLSATATGSVAQKFSTYIYFAFFGSMSGGSGASAYFHGYTVGIGMAVGLCIALGCLFAATTIAYLEKRKTAHDAEKIKFVRSTVVCVGCIATAILLAYVKLYGVFTFTTTSVTQAVAYYSQYSFTFKPIVFPALNLAVFASCILLFKRTSTGFTRSSRAMLAFDLEPNENAPVIPKKHRVRSTEGFLVCTVASALAAIAAILLRIPSLGFGWDFYLHPYLIAIFTVSATCSALLGILLKQPDSKTAVR